MSTTYIFERLTPQNAAVLLIDHHSGLMRGVQSMNPDVLKSNTLALAQIAKIFSLPVILTGEPPYNAFGPLLPELKEMFSDHEIFHRTTIDAWDDPRIVAAVEQTGRKKLIIAAVSTEVCLLFPCLSAVAAGYDVYAVLDASGTWNTQVEQAAILRMQQAGVKATTWNSVAAELQHDWALPTGSAVQQVFGQRLDTMGLLLTNVPSQNA